MRSPREVLDPAAPVGGERRRRGFFPLKGRILRQMEWVARAVDFMGYEVNREPHFTANLAVL